MLGHSLDKDVYIRSMASRGDEGGLSRASKNVVRILDAAGFDIIFVETVGIGQAEVDIVGVADTIVVVLMPETGDEIQAAKAGLMEIGDIFAVNKSDLPGADKVLYNLGYILSTKESGWRQIVVKVSAKSSEGLQNLLDSINKHENFLRSQVVTSTVMRKELGEELVGRVNDIIASQMRIDLPKESRIQALLEKDS